MNSVLRTHISLGAERKVQHLEGKLLSRFSVCRETNDEYEFSHFGTLRLFRETTLGTNGDDVLIFDREMQLLVIPMIGLTQVLSGLKLRSVDVGEALLMTVQPGEICTFLNSYESSNIHYVVAAFASDEKAEGVSRFSMRPNKLLTLFREVSVTGLVQVAIGLWKGREEGHFIPSGANTTFAWVIQGAFEVEDCLLQKSDGLTLTGPDKIEFEALCDEAIIIFMEMS